MGERRKHILLMSRSKQKVEKDRVREGFEENLRTGAVVGGKPDVEYTNKWTLLYPPQRIQ
jgi:hypothetical protein